MEAKKFEVKFENGNVNLSLDADLDGKKSVELDLNLGETLEEVLSFFKKGGEKSVEAKKVDFSFEDSKLLISVDLDQDGEKLLVLKVDLAESLTEVF